LLKNNMPKREVEVSVLFGRPPVNEGRRNRASLITVQEEQRLLVCKIEGDGLRPTETRREYYSPSGETLRAIEITSLCPISGVSGERTLKRTLKREEYGYDSRTGELISLIEKKYGAGTNNLISTTNSKYDSRSGKLVYRDELRHSVQQSLGITRSYENGKLLSQGKEMRDRESNALLYTEYECYSLKGKRKRILWEKKTYHPGDCEVSFVQEKYDPKTGKLVSRTNREHDVETGNRIYIREEKFSPKTTYLFHLMERKYDPETGRELVSQTKIYDPKTGGLISDVELEYTPGTNKQTRVEKKYNKTGRLVFQKKQSFSPGERNRPILKKEEEYDPKTGRLVSQKVKLS
jgi:hypothetical protein